MNLKKTLLQINNITRQYNLSKPYIVGGLPRDKVLGRDSDIQDVDLTTGDSSIKQLAQISADALQKDFPNLTYKVLSDGHSQIDFGDIKFDFSSNYISPSVDKFLVKAGKTTPMQKELFSRDFTCNTLVVALDLKKIEDLTGLAINDINDKTIRTPMPPEITLTDNTKRVVRIIYLAAKLGFKVDDDIVNFVKKNPDLAVRDSSDKYLSDKLKKSMEYNYEQTFSLINTMGLQNYMAYV